MDAVPNKQNPNTFLIKLWFLEIHSASHGIFITVRFMFCMNFNFTLFRSRSGDGKVSISDALFNP